MVDAGYSCSSGITGATKMGFGNTGSTVFMNNLAGQSLMKANRKLFMQKHNKNPYQ